jgi:hypothetical protein
VPAKGKGVAARRGLKEAWSESRDSMNKNRISGSHARTSRPRTTKSVSIKGRGCRSGGCAVKAVELTSGGLPRVRVVGRGLRTSQGVLTAWQKSAEGVVVRDVGEANEALQGRKAQPTDMPNRERRTKARTVWSGQ